MPDVEIRASSLAELDHAAFAEVFNLVYTDYVVPFRVDEVWARRHLAANDIAPEASLLWRDARGAIVGLAALGVRGARGWVGGFGIAPAFRGQGLSRRLIAALVERARECGLRRVQLEVITSNERAIRAYAGAGFVRSRDLLILAPPAGDAPPAPDAGAISDIAPDTFLAQLAAFDAPEPCWQRELTAPSADPELRGLALGGVETPAACLLYRATARSGQIQALAGRDAAAIVAATAALAARLPGRALGLVNEPEGSPAGAALLAAGWRETLRQHEMVCTLA